MGKGDRAPPPPAQVVTQVVNEGGTVKEIDWAPLLLSSLLPLVQGALAAGFLVRRR